MANRFGQAAQFAYDPEVFCAYLDSKSATRTIRVSVFRDGIDREQKAHIKVLNGVRFRALDGRQVLRWRQGQAVTAHGSERFLATYNLTTKSFERWARRQRLRPVLRDRRPLNDSTRR